MGRFVEVGRRRGLKVWPCERMDNDRIAKRVYAEECNGSRSVGRPRKRWINILNYCLRRRGLDVRQARRRMQERSEWGGFVRGNAWRVARETNP